MLGFIKGCRFVFKDFIEISILLYPVSKSPCNKAEIPVLINLFNVPDLVVVKIKCIF